MEPLPTDRTVGPSFDSLADELVVRFGRWTAGPDEWEEPALDEWARAVFAVQYAGNEPYRKYCDARGTRPVDVSSWRDVPAVPTAAFRAVDLIVGRSSDAALVFRTSGTTGGAGNRGSHLVRRPDLYRSSLRAGFKSFVTGDKYQHIICTLLPSFTFEPDSSLGWMMDDVRDGLGAPGSLTVAGREGIDWSALSAALDAAAMAGRPMCIMGTTLSFAAWKDHLDATGARLPNLAPDSHLMDTGGTKGRAGLQRDVLMVELAARLGLEAGNVVNEFGMTELLSQRYAVGPRAVPLAGPPWLRTRVLDPVTLEELPDGEKGILCHFDLANLGSVSAVLTEDQGRAVRGGIEWLGRTPGAPPRGCSLATAQLLDAQNDD